HPSNDAASVQSSPASEPETVPLGAAAAPDTPAGGRRSNRRRAAWPAAIALLLLVYGYSPDRFDRTSTAAFFDVGQGDAALIRTADGRHILIDGGGTSRFIKPGDEWRQRRDPFEVGRRTLVPL